MMQPAMKPRTRGKRRARAPSGVGRTGRGLNMSAKVGRPLRGQHMARLLNEMAPKKKY